MYRHDYGFNYLSVIAFTIGTSGVMTLGFWSYIRFLLLLWLVEGFGG